MDSMTIN